MRLIATLLALASLAVPVSSQTQTVRYRDIQVRGILTVLDLGRGPQLVISGSGPADGFVSYTSGSAAQVGIEFSQLWVYDGHACRAGHAYAIRNSGGFYEQCYALDLPMQWGPLRPILSPDGMGLQARGGYTSYSISICERLPGWGDTGESTCPDGNLGGCVMGRCDAQMWSVVLSVTG